VKLVDYDDDDHHHDLHNNKLRITRNIHSSKIFQILLDCRNATERVLHLSADCPVVQGTDLYIYLTQWQIKYNVNWVKTQNRAFFYTTNTKYK
jgi:hypothetical protein